MRGSIPHLRQTICEKIIQTRGEIKLGKVFRGVPRSLGEFVEDIADTQALIRGIRKVSEEILRLASEYLLLNEVGECGEKVKGKGGEGRGGKQKVLADGRSWLGIWK